MDTHACEGEKVGRVHVQGRMPAIIKALIEAAELRSPLETQVKIMEIALQKTIRTSYEILRFFTFILVTAGAILDT